MSVKQVHLIDGTTGDFVAATLHENLNARNLELIERVWSEHRARLMADLLRHGVSESKWPQSLHWNWTAKAGDLGLLAVNGTGVEIHGEWHALMMTKTVPYVARHPGDRGMPIVYVDYVESAPWNWHIPALTPLRPRFKGSGTLLIREAVLQSCREGFHGRVCLHALPQAEPFYEHCGMTRFGPDSNKQNLSYFEFNREQALRFRDGGTP